MNRAQWNKLADEFEIDVCDITREETHDQVKRYLNAVPLPRRAVLVDLGCGIGSFVLKYGDRFASVIGVEFASKIIARAKTRCAAVQNVKWLTMDIPRSVASVGCVADLTVCMNVITAPNEATRAQQWASIAAVTKPKGHALIVVPSMESDRMIKTLTQPRLRAVNAKADGLIDRAGAIQKHFARAELAPILTAHGFTPKRIGRVFYPWAKEGIAKPRNAGTKRPWDWIILAQRQA